MKWFSLSVLGSQKKFWVEKEETGWERESENECHKVEVLRLHNMGR